MSLASSRPAVSGFTTQLARAAGALGCVVFFGACDAPQDQAAPEPTQPRSAASSNRLPIERMPKLPVTNMPGVRKPPAQQQPAAPPDPPSPASYRVEFETTQGNFEVECTRDWAPLGVDRFYNLVKSGFFTDIAFFRVVKAPRPFVVQFGIHGDPAVSEKWRESTLGVDPVNQSNTRGTLTYAMAGAPTTRTTQLFINFGDNTNLDGMGFAPICKVVEPGMDIVEKLNGEYGEQPSRDQGRIQAEGNAFLKSKYPNLDYIKSARVNEPSGSDATPSASGSASAGPASSAAPSAAPATSGSAKAGPAPTGSAKAGPAAK